MSASAAPSQLFQTSAQYSTHGEDVAFKLSQPSKQVCDACCQEFSC